MKRLICLALTMVLCLGLLTVGVSASSAYGYYTGPDSVQAGDTITLHFGVGGTNIYGVSGALSYDSAMLTLVSTSASIGGGWLVEFNGSNFVAYDNNQTSPINGSSSIFSATFRVNAGLSAGTRISASCAGVVASDGQQDMGIGTVTYSTVLITPAEDNVDLQDLSVSNGTLSPAFQADVTEYTVTIPYGDSKANISAVPVDSSATVTVSDASVSQGQTKQVTVTVTAASGTAKTYTISVTREKEPAGPSVKPTNPPAIGPAATEPTQEATEPTEVTEAATQPQPEATDGEDSNASCDLKDLKVIDGVLEPAFNSSVTEYKVKVSKPVELENIIAETADPEARLQVAANEDGTQFDVTVIGKDGNTKTYTIQVEQADGEADADASGHNVVKCGFNCPCIWLWLVSLVLLMAVLVMMFILYKKLSNKN